ncbi:hypothetical protein H7171_03510 [Candidatus Saccharibacteria bacterium]|nr:hypothetical protein [Candidatus Saccharibacteria bacterium]
MRKNEQGFSVIEGLLAVVVLVVISGVGYSIYHRSHSVASTGKASTSSSPAATVDASAAQSIAPIGTTASVDNVTVQDANSESGIDAKHASSDQSSSTNSDGAATDVGGAYNESTL